MDIKSQNRSQLEQCFTQWDEPAYRLTQLLNWLYRKRASNWDEMSNLSRSLREKLAKSFSLYTPQLATFQGSIEETVKFLWRLHDGQFIESVLLKANPSLYGEDSDRRTLCVSTQVGCAYGCSFCASGLGGWKRNLAADEIIEQVLSSERWILSQKTSVSVVETSSEKPVNEVSTASSSPITKSERLIHNLVIMGMGEPLANYDSLMTALHTLNAEWGCGIGARKITISTSGLAPEIRRLAHEPEQFRLAISLHGATDAVRSQIMPVNRKYPLKELLSACIHYLNKKGKMISLEFILIAGVNDTREQAERLVDIARQLHAKVNLIPYNQVEGLQWKRPSEEQMEQFHDILEAQQIPVTLRQEKGHNIDAACGQLRLKNQK